MFTQFSRTQLIFGKQNMQTLYNARIAVFGVGGVGGFAVEAFARSGIGCIDIIDNDCVSLTNLNRQIYALHSTIGKYKVDVAKERILDINPNCKVNAYKTFFLPETSSLFDFSSYDYVVDCIDTVTGKVQIVVQAKQANVPVISCMGAGNKLNPTMFEVTDISKTSVCPLARVMRHSLKKCGIEHLKVLYSKEKSIVPIYDNEIQELEQNNKTKSDCKTNAFTKQIPGSNAFVPSVAGLIIAGEVIKDLITKNTLS